jgi:hypothetical protein
MPPGYGNLSYIVRIKGTGTKQVSAKIRAQIGKHVRVRVFEEAEAVRQQRSCISPLVGTDFGSARFRFARDSPLEGDGFEPSVPRQKDNAFRDSLSQHARAPPPPSKTLAAPSSSCFFRLWIPFG